MKSRDFFLALLVVMIWGANFTVIKLGLSGIPSLLLVALRFTFTAFPLLAFVKRPNVEWYYCVAYGLTVGVGQFGCLFYAMEVGMPAGIASVVLQAQAFFTPLFAVLLLKESLTVRQGVGIVIAGLGLYFIGSNLGAQGLASIPPGPFFLTLLAAAFFGLSNIVIRHAATRAASRGAGLDTLSLVVWSSLTPPLPLLALALLLDTPQTLIQSVLKIQWLSVFALIYLVFFATLFGLGIWGRLLTKYAAVKVAPLSLLVPVTGLITAQLVLGEQLSPVQWVGAAVILVGLFLTSLPLSLPVLFKRKAKVCQGNRTADSS